MQEEPNPFDTLPAAAPPSIPSTMPRAFNEPIPSPIPSPTGTLAASIESSTDARWEAYLASGFNTSGSGPTAILPGKLRGFNWGAFLLSWIWGIGHGAWIGLLCFVPFIGTVMPFVMAFSGNEWAWQNRKWDSVEHFRATQRVWAIWGIAFFLLKIAVFVGFYAIFETGHGYGAALPPVAFVPK